MDWGLLGPETLSGERRTRTLELGAAVRSFNDLAVPGLGGVWFGKQLFLATLGVAVAEAARKSGKRVQNIEVTNAVEAIACWLALKGNGWQRDPRIRGATKMRGKEKDLSYANVRKRNFYITQPMRQATVQPLRALGLVEASGELFNSFECTEHGHEFLEIACTNAKNKIHVLKRLAAWVKGDANGIESSKLRQYLSPIKRMPPDACRVLRERLLRGGDTRSPRRKNALAWVEVLRDNSQEKVDWDAKPAMLDVEHWNDLHAGARFFAARDAAIALLDEIEFQIDGREDRRMPLDATLPRAILDGISALRARAQTFLDLSHDPSPRQEATRFCRECADPTATRVLEHLLAREGRVLQRSDRFIVPGAAFRGSRQLDAARSPEDGGAETDVATIVALPEAISHRIRNLFLLNLDIHGELGKWLGISDENAGEEI